jgi:hypothetical protein
LDNRLKDTVVIDDIIPVDLQDKFHALVVNQSSWFFVQDMSYSNGKAEFPSYGFNMLFKHPKMGIVSQLYEAVSVPIVNSLIDKTGINIKEIYANRAFLQVPLAKQYVKEHNGIHLDITEPHYACVYYMNDTDGDTIVYNQTIYDTPTGSNVEVTEHKRVSPKKGRLVMFDGARYHCSSQPTENYRCIINFVLTI